MARRCGRTTGRIEESFVRRGSDAAQCGAGVAHGTRRLPGDGEVRLDDRRPSPGLDNPRRGVTSGVRLAERCIGRGRAVNRHIGAGIREGEGDGAADADAASRDEGVASGHREAGREALRRGGCRVLRRFGRARGSHRFVLAGSVKAGMITVSSPLRSRRCETSPARGQAPPSSPCGTPRCASAAVELVRSDIRMNAAFAEDIARMHPSTSSSRRANGGMR